MFWFLFAATHIQKRSMFINTMKNKFKYFKKTSNGRTGSEKKTKWNIWWQSHSHSVSCVCLWMLCDKSSYNHTINRLLILCWFFLVSLSSESSTQLEFEAAKKTSAGIIQIKTMQVNKKANQYTAKHNIRTHERTHCDRKRAASPSCHWHMNDQPSEWMGE